MERSVCAEFWLDSAPLRAMRTAMPCARNHARNTAWS
ncbi:hypothetical protein EV186_103735 [Labedaea rhizosphaerae]|uniref:Uncharacterized protein n=1 Tax=Labedaea rhizosphaerae TaxID=598644 RepID=A0A4R6SCG1_LABRH|nr:hypothetical protein EV186_103735 [Labedaea rhizosphaerae]